MPQPVLDGPRRPDRRVVGRWHGAVVGEHNDNPTAGAVIGAAVGSTAGAVVGSGIDQRQAERSLADADAGDPLLISDVVTLSVAGLSDEVIINHIQSQGFAGQLTAADLISLKQQGISDRVIEALQQPPLKHLPSQQTVIIDQNPVVSVEPHVVFPFGPRRGPVARRGGWSIGFGF